MTRRRDDPPPGCLDCGEPKSGQGARLCAACRAARLKCACGKAKIGQSRWCLDCELLRKRELGAEWAKAASERTEKRCSRCREILPRKMFSPNGRTENAYCKPCYSRYALEYRAKKKYGITGEDYDAILFEQNGRCAICHNRPRSKRLAIDHNHKTGQVRGLLCRRCNQNLLGAGHEDLDILRRAVAYLEYPPAPRVLERRRRDDK